VQAYVRVRLLGPIDVQIDGASRPIAGLRRKAVLAALALEPGRTVSIDRLVDLVWRGAAPVTATNTLQSHISYLRNLLGDRAAVLSRPPGYLLALGEDATDVVAAEGLIRQAEQSADPATAAESLEAAIALWRGPPLADLAELAGFDQEARRLERLLDRARFGRPGGIRWTSGCTAS
jgi:DNA-binding SARP family transcriptional activator